ncbi:hypothetical protein D3C79_907840 [compost metagenome]
MLTLNRLMLAFCWNGACRLFYVGVLVLGPVHHLDCLDARGFVAANEALQLQSVKHTVDIDIVCREQGHLQALWTPFPVGFSPHADEQEARGEVQVCQVFVGEEARLDISRSGHHWASRLY